MNFVLGLVLSLTDDMTDGIRRASDMLGKLTQTAEEAGESINHMSASSALRDVRDMTDQLGSAFLNAGGGIISTLSQVIGKVNETGQTLMYAENQLNALYASSGKTGKEVIAQIQQYAKESMFDFENLIPAVTSLKSVGIEAFDAITSSTGNAQYSLLDYASALASFAPQMKNAYGSGINAAIGAMREYIAEGNAMSLKRGAGLDITGILGEDKGATIEERTRQVADLIEQLGMLGMVDAMKESPTVKLSNMGDVLFQLKGMISDSGVYEAINGLIDIFYDFVSSIGDERLQNIAKNIGGALTAIIKPIEWVAKKLVGLADGLVSILENNPALVKLITVGSAVAGVLLILAGVALKITSALSGVSLMLLAMGKSFSSIGGFIKTGALKMMSTLLPLTATLGIMYLAWKSDFAGIRTNVTNFVSGVTNSFKTARNAVNGSVEDLTTTLTELKNKNDFFSNLTLGIMKVIETFKILKEAWNDNTISEDSYLKMKELGIEPLVNAILDLKYRFEFFKEGFVAGWQNVSDTVSNFIQGIVSKVKGTAFESIFKGITSIFQSLSNNDPQAWRDLGEFLGDAVAKAVLLLGVFKLFKGVIEIGTKIFNVFKTVWGVITTVGKLISGILTIVGTVVTGILGFFGVVVTAPAWVVGAITAALVAIIALIVKYRDEIWEKLKVIGGWIYDNVITPIGNFFSNLWNDVVQGAKKFVKNLVEFFSNAVTNIKNFFSPLVSFFSGVWDKIVNKFKTIGTAIGTAISSAVKGAINKVLNKATSIINGFISAINGVISIINALPGVNLKKLSKLSVPQLAEGGVVTKPTMAVVGEDGGEAVMPLENNTGWISKLAGMITTQMQSMRPTNTSSSNITNQGNNNQRYLTNNNSTTTNTYEGNTDNSVVFNQGAIQVTVQNATEEEAVRLAKKILEYIKRQRELDRMVAYG